MRKGYFSVNRWLRIGDSSFISIAMLLIVGTTLSWVAYNGYWQAQESEYRLLEAHARNANVQVVEALNRVEVLLNQVAVARQKRAGMPAQAFFALLDTYRNILPGTGTLMVADARGRITAATDPALVGRDISRDSYFTTQTDSAQQRKLFMSRPDNQLIGTTAVVFSVPMHDHDGQFHGIAGLVIDYAFFPKVLELINPDDSASMTVIFNRTGDIVFRRENPEKYFGMNVLNTSKVVQEHFAAGRQVTRHIGPSHLNGMTRLFLVRNAGEPGLELGLILSRQLDEVLAKWRRDVVAYALIFAFTAVVVVSLGIVAGHRKREVIAEKLRAEDANRAKSKFLAAVSHDLRQPIHAQGLFLDALGRTELSARQHEILDRANAASMSAVSMLNTLQDFSRIEAGVIKPREQAFRLQPLLNKIEREFEVQADAKGLAYRSRETDLLVRSDPMLLELILRNLVSNAIRYTERGGLLVVCRKRGGTAVLEVWDTGIGIAPADQQTVFREFIQLNNPEQNQQRGLGLGLAIVDGLARTLGHRLSLVSRPHHGSVFRVFLPIVTGTAIPEDRVYDGPESLHD